jgi:hypothetical protein
MKTQGDEQRREAKESLERHHGVGVKRPIGTLFATLFKINLR